MLLCLLFISILFSEKDVVMTMLKSGATEDIRLKKALQSTLAEEAMPGVEEWVKSASDKGSEHNHTLENVYTRYCIFRGKKKRSINCRCGWIPAPWFTRLSTLAGYDEPGLNLALRILNLFFIAIRLGLIPLCCADESTKDEPALSADWVPVHIKSCSTGNRSGNLKSA